MKYFALFAALLLALACGSKNTATPFAEGGAAGTFATGATGGRQIIPGSGGSGGASGGSGGSTTGGEAGASDLEPSVTITSPVTVTDPNTGAIVTTNPVKVLCDVSASTAAGATVDLQTVKIEAFDAKGAAISTSATASTQNAMDASEYGATVSLVGISNGPISFKCSVSDKSTPPVVTSVTNTTFYDQGPTITVQSPQPASSLSLKTKALFKFSVTAAPLSTADKLAAVDMMAGKVTLSVDDEVISLVGAQDPNDASTYSVNVDLNDPTQFPKTPTGTVPVDITAVNARGTVAKTEYNVDIDGTPPVIQILSPGPGAVVGGHVTVQFTVTDSESGVDASSVNIVLDSLAPVFYDPTDTSQWSVSADGKTFNYGFQSTDSSINSAIVVHVIIKASDNATNANAGATEDLYLDNHPPILDLDPPIIQERKSTGASVCSEPFDPLGASPNDLSVVPSAGIYRALVWDVTNTVDGENIFHYAYADQSSVVLYAQADPATPLLIDTNDDGICDNLNANATIKPASEDLIPIPPQGASYFDPAAPVIKDVCGAGTDGSPPPNLCAGGSSDLTRVIDHDIVAAIEPVVYAIKGSSAAECTGQDFSLIDAGLPNGWVCLAALGKDNVGNLGISRPLRVCLNSTVAGKTVPACAISSTTPPVCTDGCTPPARFIEYSVGFPTVPNVLDLPK